MTLILDTLEQGAAPLLSEFAARAKVRSSRHLSSASSTKAGADNQILAPMAPRAPMFPE